LLREVALVPKKKDLDLSVLTSSIRIKKKIDEMMDLKEDQIESFIENTNIHCFMRDLTAEEFVNIVNTAVTFSANLGMPVDQMANYITKRVRVRETEWRNKRCKSKTTSGIRRLQNITMNNLEE
jgi:UDP-N-acetyl-D-mannosaminuronic acid transferase (WecB/TagA/CpsF family)